MAVVVVVVAFVILQGGDDEPSGARTATATTTATETETETETQAQAQTQTQADTAPAPTATATQPEAEVATVRVVGGQPQGGVKTFVFHSGDQIRLRVISDTADEVHVHGYDLKQDVPAGGETELEFEATIEGRFEVELEGAATQLATLEVRP